MNVTTATSAAAKRVRETTGIRSMLIEESKQKKKLRKIDLEASPDESKNNDDQPTEDEDDHSSSDYEFTDNYDDEKNIDNYNMAERKNTSTDDTLNVNPMMNNSTCRYNLRSLTKKAKITKENKESKMKSHPTKTITKATNDVRSTKKKRFQVHHGKPDRKPAANLLDVLAHAASASHNDHSTFNDHSDGSVHAASASRNDHSTYNDHLSNITAHAASANHNDHSTSKDYADTLAHAASASHNDNSTLNDHSDASAHAASTSRNDQSTFNDHSDASHNHQSTLFDLYKFFDNKFMGHDDFLLHIYKQIKTTGVCPSLKESNKVTYTFFRNLFQFYPEPEEKNVKFIEDIGIQRYKDAPQDCPESELNIGDFQFFIKTSGSSSKNESVTISWKKCFRNIRIRNKKELREGNPMKNHDDQKIRYDYRRDAQETIAWMKFKGCIDSQYLNEYYNGELDYWYVGRSHHST